MTIHDATDILVPHEEPDAVPFMPEPSSGPPSSGRRRSLGPTGLAFSTARGPLVALCGLAGGAGTSTLALLLAHQAAAESTAPVMLCELDAAAGGLATLAGTSSPRSIGEVAVQSRGDHHPSGLPFVTLAGGLRLMASSPRVAAPVPGDDLQRALEDTRRAHGVTFVDCGTVQTAGALAALGVASHVVWVVPAAPWAADRVRATLLESGLAVMLGDRPEVLTVVATRPGSARGTGRALRDVAAERCRRLVYVPFDEGLASGRVDDPRGRMASALAAIGTFLDDQRLPGHVGRSSRGKG